MPRKLAKFVRESEYCFLSGLSNPFLNKLATDLYLDQPLRALYMARSLEWTSRCEQGKKIKGNVSRNLSQFKQQDSTYKRRPFFKTC